MPERYPKWVRIALIVLAVWLVLAVIVFFLGAASSAQAAGPAKTDVAYLTTSDSVSAVAASNGSSCRSATRRVNVKNKLGWTLFWVRLGKYWCWRGRRVVYRPAPSFSHGVTSFGALMQWHDQGTIDKGTWNSLGGWLSRSWGTAQFNRCIPAPILGCVAVGSSTPSVSIYAFGDGTYHY